MSNNVLFLFSSNAEALYAQDAINVVALPRGAVAHFRYDRRWVDPLVWQEIEAAQQNGDSIPLRDTRVLCVFADRSIHSGLPLFVPTRFGRLLSCETRGSVLHCYFAVEGYYDWDRATRLLCGLASGVPTTPVDHRRAIKEHRRRMQIWLGDYENEKKETRSRLPLSLFVVRATDADLKKSNGELVRECPASEDKHAWENVVKSLHALPYFADTIFYRLSSVQMVGKPELGRWAWLPKVQQDWAKAKKRTNLSIQALMPNVYGYRIARVAPYELIIDIYQGRDLSARMKEISLSLSFDMGQFFRSLDTVPILAKFDSVKIILFPVFGSLDGPSHMSVRALVAAKDSTTKTTAAAEIVELSHAHTDSPATSIGGFEWFDATTLTEFKAEQERRKQAGGRTDHFLHMAVVGPAPHAPQLTIPVETVHSMHYLMVGGFWAFLGFSLHLLATEKFLNGVSGLLPDWLLRQPFVTLWGAEAALRVLGAWLIFRAFVYATRKLPTSGVK